MSTISNKRSDQIAADQAMIAGVTKFLSQIASLPVGSQTMTPASIIQVFQDRINTGQAVQAAEAARSAAVKTDLGERAKTAVFVRSFRNIVRGMYSQSPDTLAVFNLTVPKVVKKTVAIKAEAVVKTKATRKARNTMGSKQKKAITGAAPAVNNGPVAALAAPTPPKA